MISPPTSPTFTPSRYVSGKAYTENDSPPPSPKRSFAQLEEDQLSQPEFKRRDLQSSKRAPLDPLSASDLENRRSRGAHAQSNRASYHTLVSPSSVSDLVFHPEHLVSSGPCGMQRSGIPDALVCSWPPPIAPPGTARSSHSGLVGQQALQCGQQHSPDERVPPSRGTVLESTRTAWSAPDAFQTEPAATLTKPIRTAGWKSENVLQPIRPRSTSMPSIRRPPRDLWQPEPGPTTAEREPVDADDPFVHPAPLPGLPLPPSGLRRGPDLFSHASVSLSLAHGSQPLRASEHTKAVPPIGAERSRVASISSPQSQIRIFPLTQSHDPSKPSWCSPPPHSHTLQAGWEHETGSFSLTSPEIAQAVTGDDVISKEDLERLLRHAGRNKYAPRIISPLSPLRTAPSVLGLSTDPAYQLRMPSQLNNPSSRYAQRLPRRARTICDGHQALDLNATSMHCQECKRDSVGKRLLAWRYRQQQQTQTPRFQRNRTIANRRETVGYEMDEEEKSLWEEVAAVTGMGPLSFSRVGVPCGNAAHRRVVDGGANDETHDDCFEILHEGLLANKSVTLFCEVSVY